MAAGTIEKSAGGNALSAGDPNIPQATGPNGPAGSTATTIPAPEPQALCALLRGDRASTPASPPSRAAQVAETQSLASSRANHPE